MLSATALGAAAPVTTRIMIALKAAFIVSLPSGPARIVHQYTALSLMLCLAGAQDRHE